MSINQPNRDLTKDINDVMATYAEQLGLGGDGGFQTLIAKARPELVFLETVGGSGHQVNRYRLILNLNSVHYYNNREHLERLENTILRDLQDITIAYEYDEIYYVSIAPEIIRKENEDDIGAEEAFYKIEAEKEKEEAADELWGKARPRVFISHRSEKKILANDIKDSLRKLGMSAFVAHTDITPTREWQSEIEKALLSMDVLVALIDDKFSQSLWTDQEIGAAIGRQLKVIPINIGKIPYGFIAKLQAIDGRKKNAEQLAMEIRNSVKDYGLVINGDWSDLVERFENSGGFAITNALMAELDHVDSLPDDQIDRLENAWKTNKQVFGAFEAIDRLSTIIEKLRGNNERTTNQ